MTAAMYLPRVLNVLWLAVVAASHEVTVKPNLVVDPLPTPATTYEPMRLAMTPAPEVTADELRRRADANAFIGFYSSNNQWYSLTCGTNQYWAADPTWGACCTSGVTPCIYPTGCVGNVATYVNGGTGSCGDNICDTITLLNSRGVAATGVRSLVNCFPTSNFHEAFRTMYRVTFALTTSQPARTTSRTATVTQTKLVTVTPKDAAPRLQEDALGNLWVCAIPIAMSLLGALRLLR